MARIESDDYLNWTEEEVIMKGMERNLQPYAMPVFFHGGVYLGLVAIHNQEADRVWTELAWSADIKEGGSIKVSIHDRNGNTLANTEELQHTVTDHPLETDSRIKAGEIRLRFEFTGATLYAFNFGEK